MIRAVAAGTLFLVAGCSADTSGRSVVATAAAPDVTVMAGALTLYIRNEWSPAQTTLVVDPAVGTDQSLIHAVESGLRQRGFGVGDEAAAEPGSQHVRLEVTEIPAGFLVKLVYGLRQASVFFGRDPSGSLQAAGQFTRLEVS